MWQNEKSKKNGESAVKTVFYGLCSGGDGAQVAFYAVTLSFSKSNISWLNSLFCGGGGVWSKNAVMLKQILCGGHIFVLVDMLSMLKMKRREKSVFIELRLTKKEKETCQ